jgi:hypothetical protein
LTPGRGFEGQSALGKQTFHLFLLVKKNPNKKKKSAKEHWMDVNGSVCMCGDGGPGPEGVEEALIKCVRVRDKRSVTQLQSSIFLAFLFPKLLRAKKPTPARTES